MTADLTSLAQPISFTYRNWRGETAMRSAVPKAVWFGTTEWHPEPGWFLFAYDLAKAQDRDFALKDCDFTGMQSPEGDMSDTIYREGFPKGWHMVHRSDCTLLVREGDGGLFFSTAICAAPKLQQGEKWLDTARALADGYVGIVRQFLDHREACFCDRCGYGPRTDLEGDELPTSHAEKTWECLDCGHINPRPKPLATDENNRRDSATRSPKAT